MTHQPVTYQSLPFVLRCTDILTGVHELRFNSHASALSAVMRCRRLIPPSDPLLYEGCMIYGYQWGGVGWLITLTESFVVTDGPYADSEAELARYRLDADAHRRAVARALWSARKAVQANRAAAVHRELLAGHARFTPLYPNPGRRSAVELALMAVQGRDPRGVGPVLARVLHSREDA